MPSIFLRSLQPGTAIQASTADLRGEVFDGTVATINNAIDPVTRSVRVRATLPNPDRLLIAGMFMQVTLVADPRQALAIPEEAIQPVGPKSFVFAAVSRDGKLVATRKEVTIGARQSGYVEVLSGLEEGDKVITEGIIRVREGAELVLREKSMLLPPTSDAGAGTAPGLSAPG